MVDLHELKRQVRLDLIDDQSIGALEAGGKLDALDGILTSLRSR